LDRLSHDAGVFELPGRPYFIAVLIWDAPDIDGDEPLAGRVSKLVFDYYSQEDTQ
jgi:beta-lactamase class A